MKLDVSSSWDDILDSHCQAKLSYQLKIMREMKRDLSWPQNFIKKKGIEHICKILTSKNNGKVKNEHYKTLTELL